MEIEVVEESGGPDIAIIGDVDLSCSFWVSDVLQKVVSA